MLLCLMISMRCETTLCYGLAVIACREEQQVVTTPLVKIYHPPSSIPHLSPPHRNGSRGDNQTVTPRSVTIITRSATQSRDAICSEPLCVAVEQSRHDLV